MRTSWGFGSIEPTANIEKLASSSRLMSKPSSTSATSTLGAARIPRASRPTILSSSDCNAAAVIFFASATCASAVGPDPATELRATRSKGSRGVGAATFGGGDATSAAGGGGSRFAISSSALIGSLCSADSASLPGLSVALSTLSVCCGLLPCPDSFGSRSPLCAGLASINCTGLKYWTMFAFVSLEVELMSHITRKNAIIAVMKSAKASFQTPP